jgi:polyketide biosynthesis 3-hydroxy-3-methylglutaryl-CoA synthase-like enzyme PksG
MSGASPGAKILVIATDVSRFACADAAEIQEWAYSEPSSGAGAVALLISDSPDIFRIDPGAYGNHAFEVMDTCRPGPDTEAGDADLSLLAYLDCCENAFREYARRVEGADFRESFRYLAFHTPFGGMVKGAHRHLLRKLYKSAPAEIESDFACRVAPSLAYGQRVGNTAGASTFLALAGLIDCADAPAPYRAGLFSYGSGCCSEFFSGVVTAEAQARLRSMGIAPALDHRYRLSMSEYETLLRGNAVVRFGTRDATLDHQVIPAAWPREQTGQRLVLDAISGYHRKYRWV